MITKDIFNIFLIQSDSEKKGLNSCLIYIGARLLVFAACFLHMYLIYVFIGNTLIFTIIDSLILLLLFFFKKELVVKNLKDIYYFYKINFKVFVYFFFILAISYFILYIANPKEMQTIIDSGLYLCNIFRFFSISLTYAIILYSLPSPYVLKDDSSNCTYLNKDDLLNLVIKLNLIFLNLLLFKSIIIIIFGGSFIFMENWSSSSSQGQGSNNFTGGGPGGNNGNGPNPGGNNFNGPAATDGGNNRRNRSTFLENVLGNTATDSERLADYLQARYDEMKGKKKISVYGEDIRLRISPHRAWSAKTVYPSMVIAYLQDKYGKENLFPSYDSFKESKSSKSRCAELTPELIAKLRAYKENVTTNHQNCWNDLVAAAKLDPTYNKESDNR